MNVGGVFAHSDWSMFESVQWAPKSLLGLPRRPLAVTMEELTAPALAKKPHDMNKKPNTPLFLIGT